MRRLLTLLAFVFVFNAIYAQDEVTWTEINVENPGTLPNLVGDEQKNTITSLKLTGSLNGTDILYIREMAGVNYNNSSTSGQLTALDLSGANIVSGGDNYYFDANCMTEDNIIGPSMFYCCRLNTLILPNSITEIKRSAISNLDNLTTLDLGTGVQILGEYSISYNDALTQLVIPNNVTTLSSCVLYNNIKLRDLTLSDNIEAIPTYAFYSCYGLENVILPESMSIIGEHAFQHCTNLTNMSLPNSIKTVSSYAFYGCNLLENVTLPNALETIGQSAFQECKKLKTVNIPATVTSIGNGAFRECVALENVELPNSLTSIGEYAFYNCDAFTEITIPDGVTSISQYAFAYCDNLQKIVLPPTVAKIDRSAFCFCKKLTDINITDVITEIGNAAFYNCSSLTHFNIPGSVTTISQELFSGSGITSISIPGTVTSIGASAFSNCKSLTEVNIQEGVQAIGNRAFIGCNNLTSILIPQSVTNLGSTILADCTNLEAVSLLCSITNLPSSMFSGCSKLSTLILPEGLTSIESYAFNDCSSLQSLQIPATVSTIGESAFRYCASLTTITIPDAVKTISRLTFADCSQLASVTLPNQLTRINEYAFAGCGSLTGIIIPSTVTSIGNYVFQGCSALASFSWPESVTVVSNYAFNGCTSLAIVNIPDGITRIGTHSFSGCTSLNAITIPESVSEIGYYAFSTSALTSITIPNLVKTLEDYTFANCANLNSVTLPAELTSIQYGAFDNCSSLISISIPSSVTSIGTSAFSQCTALTEVHVRVVSPLSIQSNTFYNVDKNNCTLFIPDGCLTAYQGADYWKEFVNIVEEAEVDDGVALAETDWTLLKQFYEAMNTEGWTNKWIIGDTPATTGSLKGVTTKDGHVVRITLPQNNMTGNLSPAIFMLPELKEVDFSGNALTADFDQLQEQMLPFVAANPTFTSKLTYLDISDNLFSGNIGIAGQVFSQLTTLKANNCHFSDVKPELPETITTVELDNQTINQVMDFSELVSDKPLQEKLPTILLYNTTYRYYYSSLTLFLADDFTNPTWRAFPYLLDNGSNQPSWYWTYYSYDDYKGENGAIVYAKNVDNSNSAILPVRLQFEKGDANLDAKVNVQDLQHIINKVFEQNSNLFNYTAGDMKEDGDINVQDVVVMVNHMMDNEIATTEPSSSRTRADGEDADVNVRAEGGQLVFDAKVPVSSFDLTVQAAEGTEPDLSPLKEMGLQYSVKKHGSQIRIIAYSLTGGYVPAGMTLIASGGISQVVRAQGSDAQAKAIKMDTMSARSGISGIPNGLNVRVENGQIIIDSRNALSDVEWQLYALTGQLLDSGVIAYLNVGTTTISTPVPHQAILRVKTGNETIIKKLTTK